MNQMFYNEDARHNYYQYPYYAPPVWASHQAQQFPTGLGMKEVSTRRIRPCLPELDVDRVVSLIRGWESEWEQGGVSVHDDGLMQYTLVDSESHHRFYAALVLGKSSLRCSLESQEPADLLAEVTRGEFIVHPEAGLSEEAQTVLQHLKSVLGKRGFRFPA